MHDPNPNPYAAPSANLHDSYGYDGSVRNGGNVIEQVMLAPRMSRLGASMLDSLIAGIIALPFFIAIMATGGFEESENEVVLVVMVGTMMLALLALGIYNLILLAKSGQTIGKKFMNIKIVRADLYTSVSLSRIIFLRYLVITILASIPFIGSFISLANYLFIFGADQRCLHDMIADTHVIMVPEKNKFATRAAAAYNNQSANW